MKRQYTRNEKIQQYHCICRNLSMEKEHKQALLSGFGAVSSTELSDRELTEVLGYLRNLQQNRNEDRNAWRRRVIAAASAYLVLIGRFHVGDDPAWRIKYIKGMACRMTKAEEFNGIPLERLRNCYYTLVNAKKDREAINTEVYNIQVEVLTNQK